MTQQQRKDKSNSVDQSDIGRLTMLALMTGILLLAFALGARGLNLGPIWADELASVTFFGAFDPPFNAAQVVESLQTYSPDQAVLYFILGATWSNYAGFSQFALRLPSALAGVLMIASLYCFVEYAINRRAAVIAALLMSTNSFVILYFHDIRYYTMLMWLAIIHSWLYWRLSRCKRVTWRTWLFFALTTSLLLYTHNFAVILFLGLGMCHLLNVKRSRRWILVVAGWVLGALVFLPYAPQVVAGLGFNQGHTVNPLSTTEVIELLAKLLVNGHTLLWLPLLASFALTLWRGRNAAILRVLIVAMVMVVAILLINWRFNLITMTRLRYFLIAWFLIVTLFAYGITSIPQWRSVSAVFVLLWMVAGFQFERLGEVVQYAGLMARDRAYPPLHDYVFRLDGKTKQNDFLVGFTDDDRVSRVSPNSSNSTSDYYLQVQLGIDGYFLHSHLKRYRLESDVKEILAAHPQVLLAHNPSNQPLNYARTLEYVTQDFIPCTVLVDNSDLHIQRYVHPVLGCEHDAASVKYENGIQILDHAAHFDAEAERIQVFTWWDVPDENMLDQYNISLQIITPDWQNLRQIDRHLYNNIVPWNVTELSTVDLPEGEYDLILVLYRRDSGERIQGLEVASEEVAKFFSLRGFIILE